MMTKKKKKTGWSGFLMDKKMIKPKKDVDRNGKKGKMYRILFGF